MPPNRCRSQARVKREWWLKLYKVLSYQKLKEVSNMELSIRSIDGNSRLYELTPLPSNRENLVNQLKLCLSRQLRLLTDARKQAKFRLEIGYKRLGRFRYSPYYQVCGDLDIDTQMDAAVSQLLSRKIMRMWVNIVRENRESE